LGAKSELTAAIRIRGEMAGFICCEKTDDYYQWETDEVSFISNIADIFSAAYLNNELRLAKLDAEQATRQKSIFLANMSHEIRTPMNGILGITEIMQGTQLTAQQRTYLNNINTSGESLLSLINDIIDLSKIETGALTIEHIDFELSKIINDAALLFKINRDKELQFDIIIDDKLPAFIHSDPYRIKQVLINLLGNAFKFTNEGSVRLECALEKSNAPAVTIRFTVTDTGIGFDPKKSDYIFDSFTQASTPATKDYGGSGLGLNISKNLVQLLGGTIGCHSTPGVGSEFWFTIEACAAKNPALTFRPELPAVIPSSTIFNPQDYRLLVAEDNEVNSMVTTTMLKAMGFNYSLVENGQKAVEAIKDEHFDAILMDCQMPVMDGFEATRIIRKLETEGASTKIIALTANAMDGEESRCREAGMDNYLSKPFKSAELFQLLRNELTSNSSYGI
jgi:signal transduction histidine kinase/CheY-like chemotaxis protein